MFIVTYALLKVFPTFVFDFFYFLIFFKKVFLVSYSFLSCDPTGFTLVFRPVTFMSSDSIQPSFAWVVTRTIFSWVILECNIFHVTLIVHIVVPIPVVPIPPRWFIFYLQLLPPLSAPLHGHFLCGWVCYTMDLCRTFISVS